ncbi:MAG: pyruvoyl-dependent arginine decarboxylase [Promethearchaeota archaeon]
MTNNNTNINPQIRFLPKKVFFTTGVGHHRDKLQSFEIALRDAKISQFNLVPVSSIIPPRCQEINIDEGLKELLPGQIVFLVLSKAQSNKVGQYIISSIGVAIPKNDTDYGYISEFQYYKDGGNDGRNDEELDGGYDDGNNNENKEDNAKELNADYYSEMLQFAKLKSEDMALSMLAQSMGINFDSDKAPSDQKNQNFISKNNILLKSYAIGERVRKKDEYTTAIAAAVFIL